MTSSSAHKTFMTEETVKRGVDGLLRTANDLKRDLDFYQSTLDGVIAQIQAYDKRYGTSYADAFTERSLDSGARTTQILLEIVQANNGRMDKKALIDAGRAQGLGRGATKGKMRGSIGAQIEKLLRPESKKLQKDERGKIWIGPGVKP